jgi:adenylate cyclase
MRVSSALRSGGQVIGSEPRPDEPSEEDWRRQLTVGTAVRWKRRMRNRIPSSPRCKMCAAPFAGIGGLVMPFFGHARWAKNPKYCTGCFGFLRAHHGGAEIECSLLFADVRGSTMLAEGMTPSGFTKLMGRFFDTATTVLVDEGAIVDKFVGDEVIGVFIPAMATDSHAARAVTAAHRLLAATGHGREEGPWLPVGIGVNSDVAYVGSIGRGLDSEMTAMGDAVNTTARLSAVAASGEILMPLPAAGKAGIDHTALEHRSLMLRGKSQTTEVVVVTTESEPIHGGRDDAPG